jgi:hypothetical protein
LHLLHDYAAQAVCNIWIDLKAAVHGAWVEYHGVPGQPIGTVDAHAVLRRIVARNRGSPLKLNAKHHRGIESRNRCVEIVTHVNLAPIFP